MGKIEKILKKGPVEGQTTEVYPVTSTKAVYDENNKRLDNIITGLQESVYLKTPIPISTDNTTESKAQNVKNIADYVEKAKAAGIVNVDGMSVTCIIDGDYSAVGYIYGVSFFIGIMLYDDMRLFYVTIDDDGTYSKNAIIVENIANQVTSSMLVQGARRPIILATDTSEVDEETYQKLLSGDVDVILKTNDGEFCTLTYKDDNTDYLNLYFTCFSVEGETLDDTYIYAYRVEIEKNAPHTCTIHILKEAQTLSDEILSSNYIIKQSQLSPVLQEIDLTGTDAQRKAKLDKFEADWKMLTDATDMTGARFACHITTTTVEGYAILVYDSVDGAYIGVVTDDSYKSYIVHVLESNGTIFAEPVGGNTETDTSMSDTSTNPVQNKVIKAYIDGLVGNVTAQLAQI